MITLNDIVEILKPERFLGDINTKVSRPAQLDLLNTDPSLIMWVKDANLHMLKDLQCGTVICSEKLNDSLPDSVNIIFVSHPRQSFRILMETFFSPEVEYVISKSAVLSTNIKMGDMVAVGEHTVIEAGCIIGNYVEIGHNTVISKDTIIGDHVKIGSNCTIGGTGFGYEKDSDGQYILIPHIGNVVIGSQVHIGNNTCIDRAVMGSTVLKQNVKVDNLVHIAHGVQIGENSLVIANAMIAGSTKIGRDVWVAPSSSIINNISVADNCTIGMGAVVIKKVEKSSVVVGNPARVLQVK